MSRADLVRTTGLSRTTTDRILQQLIAEGAVVSRASGGSGVPGRPGSLLTLNRSLNGGIVVGMELARSRTAVVLLNYGGDIVWSAKHEFDGPCTWKAARALLFGLLDRLNQQGTPPARLRHGMLGVHGLMPSSATYRGSGRRDRRLVELRAALTNRLQTPVELASLTRLAALAEYRKRRLVKDSLIYCHLSRGVGSAILLDGKLLPGATNSAGEFGHMRLVENGHPCHCGGHGCVETEVGVDWVVRRARELRPTVRDFEDLCRLARSDNVLREHAINTARSLGHALANVCNVVNPAHVVLGGELVGLATDWNTLVRQGLDEVALTQVSKGLVLSLAVHGQQAASYGAGLSALDHVLGRLDNFKEIDV